MANPRVYLDWNASAPLRSQVKSTIISSLNQWGNPSSIHTEGRKAKGLIERARSEIADVIGCASDQIVFTSGATESAALALQGQGFSSAKIEHECVQAWTQCNLPVSPDGLVNVFDPQTSCLQIANGETGVIQNIPAGLAVTDATQAMGKIPIIEILNQVKLAFVSAHKLGGPKGIGALIINDDEGINALIKGGGQEQGRRSGTENILGIIGFASALKEAAKEVKSGIWHKVGESRDLLESILLESVPDLIIFGHQTPRLPNTTYFAGLGWKNDLQLIDLDLAGFAVSAGSACSSGKLQASGALDAMGVDKRISDCAIRVSIGPTTQTEDIIRFAETWIKKYKKIIT